MERLTMAAGIEIKGLAGAVAQARKQIVAVRTEITAFNDDIASLQKTLVGVRAQVNQVHDDLRFEAESLSNGMPPAQPEDRDHAVAASDPLQFSRFSAQSEMMPKMTNHGAKTPS